MSKKAKKSPTSFMDGPYGRVKILVKKKNTLLDVNGFGHTLGEIQDRSLVF